MMIEEALRQIRAEEGLRLTPYRCTADKLTIGYGRNLDDNGITKAEAEMMLRNDVEKTVKELKRFPWFGTLSMARKAAMVNLHFNIGAVSFGKFRNMISAIEARDFETAASELLDSQYARQVPARAARLYTAIREG